MVARLAQGPETVHTKDGPPNYLRPASKSTKASPMRWPVYC